MNRRDFLKCAAAASAIQLGSPHVTAEPESRATTTPLARRVRPGEPGWPSAAGWARLKQEVGGRLLEIRSPLAPCRTAPKSAECSELFKRLKNPFYVGDEAGLTQTSGWVDAWTSAPSVYAVAATRTADVH